MNQKSFVTLMCLILTAGLTGCAASNNANESDSASAVSTSDSKVILHDQSLDLASDDQSYDDSMVRSGVELFFTYKAECEDNAQALLSQTKNFWPQLTVAAQNETHMASVILEDRVSIAELKALAERDVCLEKLTDENPRVLANVTLPTEQIVEPSQLSSLPPVLAALTTAFNKQVDISTMTKTVGGLDKNDGSWCLWATGYAETAAIAFPEAGTYKVEVDARGTQAAGVWPNMEIRINGVKASVVVNKTTLARYAVSLKVAKGSYKVQVAFTNDLKTATEDRNLYVRRVIVSAPATTAPVPAPTTRIPARVVKIMPLGDSLTAGINGNGGYRPELYNLLKKAGYQFDFVGSANIGPATLPDRDFQGLAGLRIDQVGASIEDSLRPRQPELVLLGAGGNDISQNYDVANAPERLMALVDRILKTVPTTTVIVQTRPRRNDEKNALVITFNAEVRTLVAAKRKAGQRVRLQDNYPLIGVADVGPDNLHPTIEGNKKLAAGWFSAIQSFYKE